MPGPASSSPAPADARRQRRRQLLRPSSSAATPTSSSGSSSSSSASPGALSFFSPAPSPFHHRFFLSPLRSSAVPFSWEHRPGIPKTPARQASAGSSSSKKPAAKALPLPPSLLSSKVGAAAADPFASPDAPGDFFLVPYDAKTATWRRRRRPQHRPRRPPALASTLTDWLAVLSLYRSSCTRSRDCLAVTPPRPRSPTKAAA